MRGLFFLTCLLFVVSCNNDDAIDIQNQPSSLDLSDYFSINFSALPNYSDQYIPVYITKDNTPGNNSITNEGATLGRVLFYDTNLSTSNSVSCASCHNQANAFGDANNVSQGINGQTPRHSMRLINSRFAIENKFFWDERANSLEDQTTMPIQDHIEMGFSGENGDLNFNDLIIKLNTIEYYPELFSFAFGSSEITETKIQQALAQFVRSIQSFDSKYDDGRILVNNDVQPFPNFSSQENLGKGLFIQPPVFDASGSRVNGGVGCIGCHQAPEFDIDPNSLNNGVIGNSNGIGTDLTVTRAPSLRDVVKQDGTSNGPFMHIGVSNNFETVLTHYDQINPTGNTNLDPRLTPNGIGQQLNMTPVERDALISFITTLAGNDVYNNEKWSNPFID